VLRRQFPHLFVTLSHEILREFREYERTSTTVLNAYTRGGLTAGRQLLVSIPASLRTARLSLADKSSLRALT
jgi:N-methylhydantoinase A/oxoprolinase/acetone carboxylase beta subunit